MGWRLAALRLLTRWCLGGVCVASIGSALAAPAVGTFRTLSPAQCVPLSQAGYRGPLTHGWTVYEPYVRACPLASSDKEPAKLWLLTVFAQTYVDSHPGEASWPDFPRPLLVTSDGHCVARLPELFPFDEPRTLHLRYGPTVDGMPREILVHVSNAAVGGDYDLPALRWERERHQYAAESDTGEYGKGDMECRN